MHLRLFELARDALESANFKVLAGILSPAHDGYGKKGLLPAKLRVEMLKLASNSNPFLGVSSWETEQNGWIRTLPTLDHYKDSVQKYSADRSLRPNWLPDSVSPGEFDKPEEIGIRLVCGTDLIESFDIPNLWTLEDIERIVGDHGLVVISRGQELPQVKTEKVAEVLERHKANIHHVASDMCTDVSSTKVRRDLKEGKSVRYIVPDSVIEFIKEKNLYAKND